MTPQEPLNVFERVELLREALIDLNLAAALAVPNAPIGPARAQLREALKNGIEVEEATR
jgi:hypothetical protein